MMLRSLNSDGTVRMTDLGPGRPSPAGEFQSIFTCRPMQGAYASTNYSHPELRSLSGVIASPLSTEEPGRAAQKRYRERHHAELIERQRIYRRRRASR